MTKTPRSNLDVWETLEKTDPEFTKPFNRAGGFKGTAIAPVYSIRRMTEMFGACGTGWGYDEPRFQTVSVGNDMLVYCTVRLWYGSDGNSVYGVGGDRVAFMRRDSMFVDDEAFKKAFTDALTNAMKHLGMSADVYMGLFDDNKYVAERRAEASTNGRVDQQSGPNKSGPFWSRRNYSITAKNAQEYADKFIRAVRDAPGSQQIKKLLKDNGAGLKQLEAENNDAYQTIMSEAEVREQALLSEAA